MTAKFSIPFGYDAARGTFPSYAEDRHLLTAAPTRSGKGATIIIQALLEVPHSVVVIDPKGQNAAVTARFRRAMGQEVFALNPFGLHVSDPWRLPMHRYNPLARFRIDDPNVVADVANLAHALIKTEGKEPYFDDTARQLAQTLMLHLIATEGTAATLGKLRKMVTDIAARNTDAAKLLVTMGKSPYSFIRQPIGRFNDHEARDISAAINTAITQLAMLDNPALTDPDHGTLSANDFDFTILKKKPTTVYLIVPGQYIGAYSRFLRLMITAALDAVTSEPGGHPVLMILDEFPRLENLPAVSEAFGFAAGFNLQLWPIIQDLNQLELVYGKAAMSILSNCGVQSYFAATDLHTGEYLQRRGGMHTGMSRSRSYSGFWRNERSESRSESRVPLLPIERTMSLPADQSLVFFAGTHDPLIVGRKPYWEIPRLKGRYDPDPYHL